MGVESGMGVGQYRACSMITHMESQTLASGLLQKVPSIPHQEKSMWMNWASFVPCEPRHILGGQIENAPFTGGNRVSINR